MGGFSLRIAIIQCLENGSVGSSVELTSEKLVRLAA